MSKHKPAISDLSDKSNAFDEPPLHMSKAARNERIYQTLLSFGLFVAPIPDANGGIDCFLVSCGIPDYVPQDQG